MKNVMITVLCALAVTMSVTAQNDSKEFIYGSIYAASLVQNVTTGEASIIEELVGVEAYVFFHQYMENDNPITYWDVILSNGQSFQLEEGLIIMGHLYPELHTESKVYNATAYTFTDLTKNDKNYDGVLYINLNTKGSKLTLLEVWDFNTNSLITIKELRNVGKFEAIDEKNFKQLLKEISKEIVSL